MEITGKLIQVLPVQTGMGQSGEWRKQDIILEFTGERSSSPKKLCIGIWNDKITSNLVEGIMLKVSFNIDSREYNDKWYTNLKAWKIEELSDTGTTTEQNKRDKMSEGETDFPCFDSDLPFDMEKSPFD